MEEKRKVNGLIEFCKSKIGTPYVYGAKGEVLTEARLNQLKRENPGMYTTTYTNKARQFLGQHCTDCSGLISWYTGIIRGSYNYHDTADQRVAIGALDESMLGWALWKPGHIGVYIGNGYCIEAKGIDYGTIKSQVSATAWQKALKLWYQYADGSYARNGWYWLTEVTGGTSGWYLFDAEGYMLTGYQQDPAGDCFLLCPQAGIHEGQCMVTDKRGACKIVDKYDFTAREYVY